MADAQETSKPRVACGLPYLVKHHVHATGPSEKAELKYLCPHSLDSRYCPTCAAVNGKTEHE